MKEWKEGFFKTAKGYNSYEINDADPTFIYKIATVIVDVFKFTHLKPIIGLEQVFIDFVKEEIKITVGWDIWSGCFVMAYDKAGDGYILEIGRYLNEKLNTLN